MKGSVCVMNILLSREGLQKGAIEVVYPGICIHGQTEFISQEETCITGGNFLMILVRDISIAILALATWIDPVFTCDYGIALTVESAEQI